MDAVGSDFNAVGRDLMQLEEPLEAFKAFKALGSSSIGGLPKR